MARAFQLGVNFFLFKPVDRPKLLRLVSVTQHSIEHEKRRFQRRPRACLKIG
jgi:YesN/AraC family two-component response regulator